MITDMSPVCIATEASKVDCGGGAVRRRSSAGIADSDSDDSSSRCEDDSSSSDDSSDHPCVKCHCSFESRDPFRSGTDDTFAEDPREDHIHRGRIGPGMWHCYVAVFDGERSTIRVDGAEEPQRTSKDYGMTSDNDDDEASEESLPNPGSRVGSGFLDGLTIGSDHHFDMSLCYGEVDGEEGGEGAIAELAVFKGHMEPQDIQRMEEYLMKKHGILSVAEGENFIARENSNRTKPLRIENHWQEDEWRRQAHFLIEQRPPWAKDGEAMPLRVAANHKSVSWHRLNEITGKKERVSRIGSKLSNGSSDW